MKSKRPTRQDVARRAGVSGAAVSVVVNGAQGNVRVSAQTRERILAAVDELGYVPNPAAGALRRRRSGTLGFVLPAPRHSILERPVHHQLAFHASQLAEQRGWQVIEVPLDMSSRGAPRERKILRSGWLEGLIVAAPALAAEGLLESLVDSGIPVVELLRPSVGEPVMSVTVDSRPGLYAAVDHLVELGHRRVAFIGRRSTHPVDLGRRDAIVDRLADHGLAPSTDMVQLGEYGIDHGEAAGAALLALPEVPTAVITGSDATALGLLRHLYAEGVRVPDQVSVVSYDDVLANLVYPPLTSVAQPLQAVAMAALDLLEAATQPHQQDVHSAVLPTQLVVRASTGPAP